MVVGSIQLAAAQGTTSDPEAERKADLVTAYRILVNENILDSFGHVSVRSARDPNIFLMPRAMPPALVSQDDILELRVSDSQPLEPKGRRVNGERYIHGEIYKARPDVMSVIHSHSQAVIPLSLTSIRLRPVVAQAGFLPPETPTFEIRDARKEGDRGMQVTDSARGAALARALSSYPAALMRGHGNVVVGPDVRYAVFRAYYTEVNARLQLQARTLEGPLTFVSAEESANTFGGMGITPGRAWEMWVKAVAGE
jgi:ribulose-5-phosphate 4-epimerase/fuculose-1-phosphate aldolase